MPGSVLWQTMDARPRHLAARLKKADIPVAPGVYAWYRGGRAIYVGKAGSPQRRVWNDHLGRGRLLTSSAFRRNVAEFLGISTAAEIKPRRYQPTDEELARIRTFIEECEVSWIPLRTESAALDLERRMKGEWRPPLTKL